MARGAFPDSHRQHLGMPGMHGSVSAVTALQKADLLIALGTRFDDRVTGKLDTFAPHAAVIHADIDPAEIGKNRVADVPIVGDVREVLIELIPALEAEFAADQRADLTGWWRQIDQWRDTYPLGYDEPADGTLAPQYVIERLGQIAGPEAIFAAGVGQHQMWAAQFIKYEHPYTWLNSGGAGTMGYSVPAAMGAKVGCPDKLVWAIDGDGCFQMTNQELATCAIEGIPIKVAVINNGNLGMVRQWQTLFYERALQPDRARHAQAPHPRLREARRRARLRRPAVRDARPTSTPRSRRPWPSTTSRSSSTSPSARTRWCGRWWPPAPATTTSRPRATSVRPTTRRREMSEHRSEERARSGANPAMSACSKSRAAR